MLKSSSPSKAAIGLTREIVSLDYVEEKSNQRRRHRTLDTTSLSRTLRSPDFMRDIAGLVLLLSGITVLVGIGLLADGRSKDVESGIGLLIAAAVYIFLAMMIRRGSVKSLWIMGVLLAIETLYALVSALSGQTGAGVISKLMLIGFIIRSFQKNRVPA